MQKCWYVLDNLKGQVKQLQEQLHISDEKYNSVLEEIKSMQVSLFTSGLFCLGDQFFCAGVHTDITIFITDVAMVVTVTFERCLEFTWTIRPTISIYWCIKSKQNSDAQVFVIDMQGWSWRNFASQENFNRWTGD